MTAQCPRCVMPARQREALAHAANGRATAQAARLMGVSENTVAEHLRKSYRTLGARDRAHAVAIALVIGVLTPADIQLSTAAPKENAA